MTAADAFEPVRRAFERAAIRYAVGGSWASTAFGEPRFTNDVDIVADLTIENLRMFLAALPESFYVDAEEAAHALARGRPFNIIYMPSAFKLDLFPARAFPLGLQELERALLLENSGLGQEPVPFVTPEDTLLAKLDWFKAGGSVSEMQWRDIQGILKGRRATLNWAYLDTGASRLGLQTLLEKALNEVE